MIYNEVAEKNLAEASIWIGNSVLIKDGNCSREGMKVNPLLTQVNP